jgi:hypothetical protein
VAESFKLRRFSMRPKITSCVSTNKLVVW